MFENVKTIEDMENEFGRIRESCCETVTYIDRYLNVLKLDDEDSKAAGYSRMMEIIEAKIKDMAR